MKKSNLLSLLIIVSLICSLVPVTVSANMVDCTCSDDSIILKDSETGITFYNQKNDNIIYSAQISPSNKIQFSYIMDDVLFISNIYLIDDIYTLCGQKGSRYVKSVSLDIVNQLIIDNLDKFNGTNQAIDKDNNIMPLAIDSDLQDALVNIWGQPYNSILLKSRRDIINNKSYMAYCYEIKAIYADKWSSHFFAADAPLTALTVWILEGFDIKDTVISLAKSLVLTYVKDGVSYITNGVTVEKVRATLSITRFVTVNGDSPVQTSSSWTRKLYMFKGQYGWHPDTSDHYNIKSGLFDNIDALMTDGLDVYRSNNP